MLLVSLASADKSSHFRRLFGELIDSYTDAQALEDGVLVDLYMPARFQEFPINRMTRHLFDDLVPFVEAEAALFSGDLSRALTSILRAKCAFAKGDPGKTGDIGDIHREPVSPGFFSFQASTFSAASLTVIACSLPWCFRASLATASSAPMSSGNRSSFLQ